MYDRETLDEVRAPTPTGTSFEAVEPKLIGVVEGRFGDVLEWALENPRRRDFRRTSGHGYGSLKEYVPPEILEL